MKFVCICMSPAIDATVKLPRAPKGEGEIFKDVAEEENVGGKAVNVARWLAIRGAEVECGGLLGEDNDRPFVRELEKYGIADRFVRVPGATRRNEMVTWPGGSVKLNRAAFPGLGKEGSWSSKLELEKGMIPLSNSNSRLELSMALGNGGVVILSGSLPPALPKDFYAKAVAHFKALGCTTVLDASGEAMKLALDAGPDLIKPNAKTSDGTYQIVPNVCVDVNGNFNTVITHRFDSGTGWASSRDTFDAVGLIGDNGKKTANFNAYVNYVTNRSGEMIDTTGLDMSQFTTRRSTDAQNKIWQAYIQDLRTKY